MTQRHRTILASPAAAILLLAHAAPAAAQRDVMRDSYRFQGSALEVEVATDVPGRLRMMRGQRSRIEVSGRAPDGFTSAALGGVGVRRLSLTSMGGEQVDFVVIVPEDVRVRVKWVGSNRSELFGPLTDNAVFRWESPIGRPGFETVRPADVPRVRPPANPPATVATPEWIDVVDAHLLDRVTIRLGAAPFEVEGATESDRNASAMTVHGEIGGHVVIHVPEQDEITVALDGATALVVDRSGAHAVCDAITDQTLADGTRWFTFSPAAGDCDDLGTRSRPAHRRT